MVLKKWQNIPQAIRLEAVKQYYDILSKKKIGLVAKRVFDVIVSIIFLIALAPVFIALAIWIKIDSKGPVMFRQTRVTKYGKLFRIFKFRTMVYEAENMGTQVTIKNDLRITNAGHFLRKYRLDEIPQLFNIITGDMSFVGTRPEVPKYVQRYTDEMYATLLLPAGVTSKTSIKYKDEEKLLSDAVDIDITYIEKVLPMKMKYNLEAIKDFSFSGEMVIMMQTLLAVIRKEDSNEEQLVTLESKTGSEKS